MILLFIIIKGKYHFQSWYENNLLLPDCVIAVSGNGWIINEFGTKWIQYFDKYTRACQTGQYHLLILDGHESYYSDKFEQYCKDNNIIMFCMFVHSFHFFQLFDVSCFSPMKKVYGAEIKHLVRVHITHITKEDFFPAFKKAFDVTITELNIKGSFKGAGLVPMDSRNVLSKLDVKLVTL